MRDSDPQPLEHWTVPLPTELAGHVIVGLPNVNYYTLLSFWSQASTVLTDKQQSIACYCSVPVPTDRLCPLPSQTNPIIIANEVNQPLEHWTIALPTELAEHIVVSLPNVNYYRTEETRWTSRSQRLTIGPVNAS